MNLVQLVQQACRELALPVPNAVVSSTSEQTVQMFGLMTALGQELIEEGHDWQPLIEVGTITTTGTGSSSLPADFLRPVNGTWWDRTQNWKLRESVLPQGWRWLNESSLANASPIASVRVVGNTIQYYPTTNSGNTFAFDYIRKTWVVDGDDSSEKATFTKDADTCVFRDRLMINGLKFKFMEAKGFDATPYYRSFMLSMDSAKGEAGAPTLSLTGGGPSTRLLDYNNVPDSGYG